MYRNNFTSDNKNINRQSGYNIHSRECGCISHEPSYATSDSDMALAMAYVPWQHFDSLYDLPAALEIGTIFPELNKPFRGSKGGLKCPCRQ
jgi:hypothetical protein